MTIEIAGMTYNREPIEGEVLRVEAWDDLGNMTIAKVVAGHGMNREIIAWDQIEVPAKKQYKTSAYGKRVRLARAATAHWRGQGFEVEHFESGE